MRTANAERIILFRANCMCRKRAYGKRVFQKMEFWRFLEIFLKKISKNFVKLLEFSIECDIL